MPRNTGDNDPGVTLAPARILALDVRERGFGFAVIERSYALRDWGAIGRHRGAQPPKRPIAKRFEVLMNDVNPNVVVLGNPERAVAHQAARAISGVAADRQLPVRLISRKAMRQAFAGRNRNRHEIALAISEQFPELGAFVPPRRSAWDSEYARTTIFDAVGCGLAYLGFGGRENQS